MRSTALMGLALSVAISCAAQYPGQVKPGSQNQQNQTMRAVAVLEWTGDEEHPKASRLVPVALYDGEQLQDAGIYMARPAPLALSSEVEYELKQNGKTTGLFVVNSAGQEQGSWVGLGAWRALPKPKAPVQTAKIDEKDAWGNVEDDKPVLHRKQHDDAGGKDTGSDAGAKAPAADPDRPTLKKKTDDNASPSKDSAGGANPAPDPDRPTLHKKTDDDGSSSKDSAGGTAPVDPDRPTLKKKTDKPSAPMSVEDEGSVESVKTLSDPDRPKLMRGKPANQGGKVLPTVMGLPPDMQQAVAVSDAKNRPEHIWSYSWANPQDENNMKAAMEDIAREALGLSAAVTPSAVETKPKPATPRTGAAARSTARKAAPAAPPVAAPLLDEQFRVFELAYGSGATLVLSAHSDGELAKQKFITLICQPNIYGKVTVLFKNVTDGAHLDDTPRMRLVDAVDVRADNRGELLFELRGATQRQFALYSVLRGQVTRIFATAPGSIMPETADNSAGPHS